MGLFERKLLFFGREEAVWFLSLSCLREKIEKSGIGGRGKTAESFFDAPFS